MANTKFKPLLIFQLDDKELKLTQGTFEKVKMKAKLEDRRIKEREQLKREMVGVN